MPKLSEKSKKKIREFLNDAIYKENSEYPEFEKIERLKLFDEAPENWTYFEKCLADYQSAISIKFDELFEEYFD